MQNELAQRLERLRQYLIDEKIDLAILSEASDIFYYTGSAQPLYLFVPAHGEPIVFARKAITRIHDEAPHMDIETFHSTRDIAEILNKRGIRASDIKHVGFTLDTLSYASVTRLHKLFEHTSIEDMSWGLRTLRMVKSERELAIQAKAGRIVSRSRNWSGHIFALDHGDRAERNV